MPDKDYVRVDHLSHRFRLTRTIAIDAVKDVSFSIDRGEILGLVGESGSGKSTVARCIMGILEPSGGHVYYDGIDVNAKNLSSEDKVRLQKERQIIFQDSGSALNPRMSVRRILSEPLDIHGLVRDRGEREKLLIRGRGRLH